MVWGTVTDGLGDLKRKGLIGNTEYTTLKGYNPQLSKKGAHPPLANRTEAKFALDLTEAAVDMLIEKHNTTMQVITAFAKGITEIFMATTKRSEQ